MVPLSYIFPKDSRNILFAKFGSTELKLWIFEAYDFMSQNVRNRYRFDNWQIVISGYPVQMAGRGYQPLTWQDNKPGEY